MSDHHHKETFITKYIFSQDHKMIAKQFLLTGIFMALVGMLMSAMFRVQLANPGETSILYNLMPSNWMDPDTGALLQDKYLALVTMHGTILVFWVLTAGLSGTFANFLIPLQIGARDMASGFINMLSYWFFFAATVVLIYSIYVPSGPASAGWTIYPPLSAEASYIEGSGLGMTLWLVSITLFIVGSLLGGLNYIVTILNLRTKGMSMKRLPLTIWALFVTAILGVLSFPVLLSCGLLLVFDRSFGTSFYLSDLIIGGEAAHHIGGSPILFEHLFWFLGHPEVYIILLPALGMTSEVISVNTRKPIFGYQAMVLSLLAIGFLSFIVWGHHMFMTGMNPFLGSVFAFTTLLIAIPSAIKVFNYLTTLWRGNIRFTPAMLFAIAMVSTFITGGLTGLILGNAPLDINVHDTYFVVGHFHIVMGLSAIYGMLAGVYHWFPKMYGRMMNKNLGYLHFWGTFICAYGVFFPMHFLGLAGLPRRYYANPVDMGQITDINDIITFFALAGAVIQFIFVFNFFYSIFRGSPASKNPWKANTLEWTTPVERIHGNWPGDLPEVHRWAYDYSKPGAEEDYIPQNVPLKEGESEH
ncbi:MAG: cytochrome c oxidase subunit I [Flavobacteriales bacterium]|nr:cytochrome c oxidase subunit I [Flavobacteriales bacterium]|tara:strand:+ start:1180 stop:2931 length:1752 start_codon:yes stop_codon:yes gene_type:complete